MLRGALSGEEERRAAATALGLLVAIIAFDLLVVDGPVVVDLLALCPLAAAALGASVRPVLAIAALALAVATALSAIGDVAGEPPHLVAVAAICGTGALGLAIARTRGRLHAGRMRAQLVARSAELFDAPLDPERRMEQAAGLAVPDMADLCIIDVVETDGSLRVAGVAAAAPGVAEQVRAVRRRAPLHTEDDHPVAHALSAERAVLLSRISPEQQRRWAASPEHRTLMGQLGYASAILVPLVAGERVLGVLSLVRLGSARPFADSDVPPVRALAGRCAMAIENALLFAEVRRGELQLGAVLGNLADAVTLRRHDGRLVYANPAAAELAGVATPAEFVAGDMALVEARWELRDEDGRALRADDLPAWRALRTGEEPPPMTVHLRARGGGADRWVIAKATPVHDETGRAVLAVSVLEDVTAVKEAERTQRILAETSKLLASSLDPEVTLHKVAWAAVPELADWCAVDVLDEDGGDAGAVRPAAVAHRDDWAGGDAPGREAARRVLGGGGSVVEGDAIVVPIAVGDEVLGALTLATGPSRRRLGAADLPLAEELGRRAGIAVANARVHAARSHVAATLQRSLLPPRLPVVPGLTIAARFRAAGAASEVGGDFYDLFAVGDEWVVTIGDVTGKGPGAAATTALARYTMRTAAMYEHEPRAILARLNDALWEGAETTRVATAVCVRVSTAGDGAAVRMACGGHPSPLLLDGAGGVTEIAPPGTLLGAFADGHWEDAALELEPGHSIVLYTDGVTDMRGTDDRFGHVRLQELLAGLRDADADTIASAVDQTLLAFQDGEQNDDVALLVLHREIGGAGSGAASLLGQDG